MKTNWSLPLWVAAGLILATPGCGKYDGNTSAASGGAASKKLKLAFVPNSPSDFWRIARAGCADAEKQLGNVTVDFRIPSGGTATEQQQILDDLLDPHHPNHLSSARYVWPKLAAASRGGNRMPIFGDRLDRARHIIRTG